MKQVKAMCAIDVLEMTANGLHLVANLPTVEDITDPEAWTENLNTMIQSVYDNDKMFLVTEDIAFCIRGLQNKTIVCKPVFTIVDKEEDEE
jgi:hypothetical protein